MALLALSSAADANSLDLRCYRLMAELAREDDPRVRSAGMTGAHYFLGRLDAADSGFDPEAEAGQESPPLAERETLVRRCGEAMGAGGRDFRALGESLMHRSGDI
ncbi:hypothetical protein [Sphingosinicella sp. YJ22]|uniref:hypothetical protein n=1 Tax=Sphingosinicella sp. YJ22 TaxID=1104780 RepID=UPI001409E539|nr:hypothetical protein [Sphingosinicella sp. YJ22]